MEKIYLNIFPFGSMLLPINGESDVFFHEMITKIFDEMRRIRNDKTRLPIYIDTR